MSRSQGKAGSGWVNRFWLALEYNDQNTLRHLLASGINVNHVFKQQGHRRHGQTPLFIAVSKNNKDLVRLLLNAGCEIEQPNIYGETPLFIAVWNGKLSMVELLVNKGSNINHVNAKGENILFAAVRLGRIDFVQYFLRIGVDPNCVNKDHTSPLLLALEVFEKSCESRHATRRSSPSHISDIAACLIPLTKNLNCHHPNRGSALRVALNLETVYFPQNLCLSRLLLQHGAIPDSLFFLRFGGLNAMTSVPGSSFFTSEFFDLAVAAGANLQRERTWLATVLRDMPQELHPHLELFYKLLTRCESPKSLQTICQQSVRQSLAGDLWTKIDALPMPCSTKSFLKLEH